MTSDLRRRTVFFAMFALPLVGCDSGGTQEPPATPAITVSAAAATVEVQPGAAATLVVNVTRTGGFNGAVTIAAEGLPANVAVAQAVVAAGAPSATLNITAAANATPGSTTVTLRATGPGVSAVTTTFSLSVLQPPAIEISLSPTSISVPQIGTATTTVNLTRTGGFAGAVAVAVEGLPAGVTVPAATIAAGATSATLTFTAASADPATTELTVRATATGVAAATAALALSVTTLEPAPALAVTLDPAALSIAQGASGTVTATITRTGTVAGAVTLAAENLPAGVTIANATVAEGATQAQLTVNVAGTAAVATTAITVRATAAGAADGTASLGLTVTGSGTGGGNVTYSFCEASGTGLPIWLAVQDGDGAWTRVTGNQNHEYTYQLNATRGGVAYVVPHESGLMSLTVLFVTREEMQAQGQGQCYFEPGPTRTVNVQVSGVGPTEQAFVTLGNAAGATAGAVPTPVQLQNVPAGPVDLVASRSSIQGSGFVLNRMVIERGLNPAHNSTLNVDFANAASFAPATASLAVNNLAGEEAFATVALLTAGGSVASIMPAGPTGGATLPFQGVPTDRQVAGDLHMLSVTAYTGSPGTNARFGQMIFSTVADRAFTLGPNLNEPVVTTVATQPYPRLRAVYQVQPEYNTWFMTNFGQATTARNASVQMSAAYNGGGASAVLELPDFSSVAGWNDSWTLSPGVEVQWLVMALRYATGNNLTAPWTDGMTWASAMRSGSIMP